MSPYSTVVLAADLTEESTLLAERMKQIVGDSPCAVHIVHVIEPLSSAYGGDVPMDLSPVQDQIQEQAKIHLAEFGLQLGVPQAQAEEPPADKLAALLSTFADEHDGYAPTHSLAAFRM